MTISHKQSIHSTWGIMAQMALTAPHLLKFFGASQEVIQAVKKTKAT